MSFKKIVIDEDIKKAYAVGTVYKFPLTGEPADSFSNQEKECREFKVSGSNEGEPHPKEISLGINVHTGGERLTKKFITDDDLKSGFYWYQNKDKTVD